jgi:hypothetical protein
MFESYVYNKAVPVETRHSISPVNTFRGFEVLTVVAVENIIFWDITPCSPLSVK